MYTVILDGKYLHHPQMDGYKLSDPKINFAVNTAGVFEFTIFPSHPVYGDFKKLVSIVEVFDDEELLFRGRVLNDTTGIYRDCKIICEGELAYLNDSVLPPYEHTGSVVDLLTLYIENHNSQVENSRKFRVGNITVSENGNVVVRSNIEHANTWSEMSSKLFKSSLGGYLMVRREGDENYIDYVSDSGVKNRQSIELSKNMIDFNQTVKADDIVTVLIPLGAKLRDETGAETDERLTIASVNGGSKYIEHLAGIEKYGRIVGYQIWDDVTIATNLKTKGIESLDFLVNLGVSIKIRAVDLSLLDKTVPKLRYFEYVRIISKPHNIDIDILIKKQTINLVSPEKNIIDVGVDIKSFVDNQIDTNNTVGKIYADYITNQKLHDVTNPIIEEQSIIWQEFDNIMLEVSKAVTNAANPSLIRNGVGLSGVQNWNFTSNPIDSSKGDIDTTRLYPALAINPNDPIMYPIQTTTAAGSSFLIWHEGQIISDSFFVVGEDKYFVRLKMRGSGNVTFVLQEFNDDVFVGETDIFSSSIHNEWEVFEGSIETKPNTNHLRLYIKSNVNVFAGEFIEFTDTMLTRAIPRDFDLSGRESFEYSKSSILLLSDALKFVQEQSDATLGRIDNTTVKITAIMGVEIWSTSGNGLTIYDQNGNKTVMLKTDGTIQAINADISGTVRADRGEIGSLTIQQSGLNGENFAITDSGMYFGTTELKTSTTQGYESLSIGGDAFSALANLQMFGSAGGTTYFDGSIFFNTAKTITFGASSKVWFWNGLIIYGGHIETLTQSKADIGNSSFRFRTAYFANQPNVGSDEKLKYNIHDIDDMLLDSFEGLREKSFKTKHDDKYSFGYIAQDIEACLYDFIKKVWDERSVEKIMDDFKLLSRDGEFKSLMYAEVQVIMTAVQRRRIDRLEAYIYGQQSKEEN